MLEGSIEEGAHQYGQTGSKDGMLHTLVIILGISRDSSSISVRHLCT